MYTPSYITSYPTEKFPPNYTPVSDGLVEEIGLFPAIVYGKIWRYCQSKDKVCRAKVTTLGEQLGISGKTVERSIKILEEAGYIFDKTPTLRNRPHLYYCTNKPLPLAKSAIQTDSQSDQTNPVRLTVVPSETHSLTQADSQSDEESIEESIEESVKTTHPTSSQNPKPRQSVKTPKGQNSLALSYDPEGNLVPIIHRLNDLTGYTFFHDKKTLDAAKFIAEREKEGQTLEAFLSKVDIKRKQKYPSFPLDIIKEWKPAFDTPQRGIAQFLDI